MASIYSSAQANYNRQKANANFGRMTQSQHDAARRYAEANNMDYDPNQGYGAKGSFDTQRPEKVRDPNKGQHKGGAAGFAALGNALMGNMTSDMTPAQRTIELGRRFGGMFEVEGYTGYNPYKLPGNSRASQQTRQRAIANFERSHGYSPREITYGKNGSYRARDVTPAVNNQSLMGSPVSQNSSKPKPLSMAQMNKLSSQGGLENSIFKTPVRQKKQSPSHAITSGPTSQTPASQPSYAATTTGQLMGNGYNYGTTTSQIPRNQPLFGGITI